MPSMPGRVRSTFGLAPCVTGAEAQAVQIDMHAFRITVADDGCGIPFADLRLVGERYCTSKRPAETHGFRGEALASVRDVALLEVRTRTRDSDTTYTKLLKGDFSKACLHAAPAT